MLRLRPHIFDFLTHKSYGLLNLGASERSPITHTLPHVVYQYLGPLHCYLPLFLGTGRRGRSRLLTWDPLRLIHAISFLTDRDRSVLNALTSKGREEPNTPSQVV
jgi:hypothetical protein